MAKQFEITIYFVSGIKQRITYKTTNWYVKIDLLEAYNDLEKTVLYLEDEYGNEHHINKANVTDIVIRETVIEDKTSLEKHD